MPALPATATLSVVAALPATATLRRVAMLPATQVLSRVSLLPAIAALPLVAAASAMSCSEGKGDGLLQQRPDPRQELGAVGAVEDAVIAGQGHGHQLRGGDLARRGRRASR